MHKDIEVQAMSGFQYAETLHFFLLQTPGWLSHLLPGELEIGLAEGCLPRLSTVATVGVGPELVAPDPRLATWCRALQEEVGADGVTWVPLVPLVLG